MLPAEPPAQRLEQEPEQIAHLRDPGASRQLRHSKDRSSTA